MEKHLQETNGQIASDGAYGPDFRYPSTILFQASRGVFEGGGCRAPAHVGAFEAAVACGINFSEVAGTSAGAIIAALIGAGATPQYLRGKCEQMKFSEFLTKPKRQIATFARARIIGYLCHGKLRILGRVLREGSAYSSEKLQSWIDDRLAELLPDARRPVTFGDLIVPTWIVATDLAGKRPMVWSTEETPSASVALAVRSSSSIPLFFEPVGQGSDLFVDGGLISNLPSFVFSDPKRSSVALGGRVLAFRLSGDDEKVQSWRIDNLAKKLIDAAISGVTAVQQLTQRDVTPVVIKTGAISSMDFNIQDTDIKLLLDAGRRAVVDLVLNEHQQIGEFASSDGVRYGEDELYDDIAREMTTPGQRLAVACADTKWFWSLFPSVINWVFSGAAVDVLVEEKEFKPSELQRQKFLRGLGARVVPIPVLPFHGYLLERADDNHNAAFILSGIENRYSHYGTVYAGPKHHAILGSLLDALNSATSWPKKSSVSLELRKGDPNRLISLLKRGVKQYADNHVSIELKEVLLDGSSQSVHLLVRRIRAYKYRQICNLLELYKKFGLLFCEPADIVADGKVVSTVVPPVLESWQNSLVTIEGNTRLCYLTRKGERSISAIVVSGVRDPLPARPVITSKVLLTTCELDLGVRMDGYELNKFRSIERAARPLK
jgi:predicted acylesterase/phospholipase RssA